MTIGLDRRTAMRWALTGPFLDADQDQGGSKKDSDDNGDPAGKGTSTDGDDKGDKGFRPITSQEDLDLIVTRRLDRAKRSMKDDIKAEIEAEIRAEAEAEAAKAAGDFKALYEAEKKKVEKLEGEKKARELDELKRAVAAKVGLPEIAIPRLTGETEAELEKDAKELLALVAPKTVDDLDTGESNNGRRLKKKGDKKDYEDPNFWLG